MTVTIMYQKHNLSDRTHFMQSSNMQYHHVLLLILNKFIINLDKYDGTLNTQIFIIKGKVQTYETINNIFQMIWCKIN